MMNTTSSTYLSDAIPKNGTRNRLNGNRRCCFISSGEVSNEPKPGSSSDGTDSNAHKLQNIYSSIGDPYPASHDKSVLSDNLQDVRSGDLPSDDFDYDEVVGNIFGTSKNVSSHTLNVDSDWMNREKVAKNLESKLPLGTSFKYNKTMKLLEPVVEQPKLIGGIIQTLMDKEAMLHRRYRQKLRIQHDLALHITKETANIIALLSKNDLLTLSKKHPLVTQRLLEPLYAQYSLDMALKFDLPKIHKYDRTWYSNIDDNAKSAFLAELRKYAADPSLYALKLKKPEETGDSKRKIYKKIEEFHNDYQCQRVVRENQFADKILKMFDQQSGLYLAPLYNSIVPTTGNSWLLSRFDKYYARAFSMKPAELSKKAYSLVGRFMLMVENGTILPASPSSQVALNSLAIILSRIMDSTTEPTTFLGKTKYYGFMGMCNHECANEILNKTRVETFFVKNVLNKQLEVLKWILTFYNDDLLKVDTSAQKILLDIMYRVTRDPSYAKSYRNVKFNIKSETAEKSESLLEFELPEDNKEPGQKPIGQINRRPNGREKDENTSSDAQDNVVSKLTSPKANDLKALLNDNVREFAGKALEYGKTTFKMFLSRYLSGFRIPGLPVDNNKEYNAIVPYESFKTPNFIAGSFDNSLLDTIDSLSDIIASASDKSNNAYYDTLNTWVQVQSMHGAIHSFEAKMARELTSSKTLGALFRWLNMNHSVHVSHVPKKFLPFASLSLQLLFFLQNVVEGYSTNLLGGIKGFFKGILKFGLKGRFRAKNYAQLCRYLEPHVIYNKGKYLNSLDTIHSLVTKFKKMFLAKPAIPSPLVQYIVIFLGLWAKGTAETFDLSDAKFDRLRKAFFLSFISNNKSLADVATEIILKNCTLGNHALHLGCISMVGAKHVRCQQKSIKMRKAQLRSVLKLLEATSSDPMYIIKIASDTARRCKAQNKQVRPERSMKLTKKNKGLPIFNKMVKVPHYTDRLMLHSEFAQSYHCYRAQTLLVKDLIKSLIDVKSTDEVKSRIMQVFGTYRSIEIKQQDMGIGNHRLVCPFMVDASDSLRLKAQANIIDYVIDKMLLKSRKLLVMRGVFKSLRGKAHELVPDVLAYHPLGNLAGCVMVGTRFYNGVFFSGGYFPMERVEYPKDAMLRPGEGRLVYDGSEFVPELTVLNETSDLKYIRAIPQKDYVKYYYGTEDGTELDERDFGIASTNFVVRAHVLTTTDVLLQLGFDLGRVVWCGYKYGWVADFVLQNVIGTTDVPVFNGRYWLLSKELRVEDLIGYDVKIPEAEDITKNPADQYNVMIVNGNNEVIYDNTDTTDKSAFSTIASTVYGTELGNVTPGGIKDLVKDVHFNKNSNTLTIDLDSPDFVYGL